MKNNIKMQLEEGMIKIPSEVINELKLRDGDSITIEYQGKTVRDHCFSLESDCEENMFDEGFYCIPNRLLKEAGLKEEAIDVVINDNEIVLTQSKDILNYISDDFLKGFVWANCDHKELYDYIAKRYQDENKTEE